MAVNDIARAKQASQEAKLYATKSILIRTTLTVVGAIIRVVISIIRIVAMASSSH